MDDRTDQLVLFAASGHRAWCGRPEVDETPARTLVPIRLDRPEYRVCGPSLWSQARSRPYRRPRPDAIGRSRRQFAYCRVACIECDTVRKASPSRRCQMCHSASQMRVAFSNMRRTPAARSPGDADDLEHLGGRGLLLQRFGEIVGALAQLVSRRAFSMAMTACAAKFFTSSICLSENGRTSCAVDHDRRRSARPP